MEIAYFITASILCVWAYCQTRRTARSIRSNRRNSNDLIE